jgi:hypothetical protein
MHDQFRGVERAGAWPFAGEKVGVPLFSAKEKENIDISGNFRHFRAQEVPKVLKNRSKLLL